MNKTEQKSIETLKKDIIRSTNNICIINTKDIQRVLKIIENQEKEIKILKKKSNKNVV